MIGEFKKKVPVRCTRCGMKVINKNESIVLDGIYIYQINYFLLTKK